MFNKASILTERCLAFEKVLINEWGGEFLVRELTGEQREILEWEAISKKDATVKTESFRAKLAAWCVCDDEGVRVFSDDDIPTINKTCGAAILDRIADVVMRLSGLQKEVAGVPLKN